MSHTTRINGITITDVTALRAAITELKAQGVKCDLLENAQPRGFFPNQSGMETAPYVLKLEDSRYDVGLYPNTQGKGYECRTDFWGGDVERHLGTPNPTTDQARLGKLYQMYGVHAATRQAMMQGYTVQRSAKADGTIQLVLGNV